MKLTFKITLLSDYHIGTGFGKGIIDSLILRDRDDLPVIRGTTLSGLLRQGMWELLQTPLLGKYKKCEQSDGDFDVSYCSMNDIISMCPICRILGTPAYPKKWKISSAEIGDSKAIPEKVLWRSRVNPRTRTSEARKLFRDETAGKGTNFVFTVSNESNEKQTLEEASFIAAAFRVIRNLGASRRRGKGSCQIHLIDVTPSPDLKDSSPEDYLLDTFKTRWLENKDIEITEQFNLIQLKGDKTQKKSFNIILLTEEPLLIADKSESGNRYHTNIYIPGYTLLGALAWKIAQSLDLNDNKVYEKFIKLFRKGEVKVSPLYPAWKLEDYIYPSIPSPQDFLTCKKHPEKYEHGIKGYATDVVEPPNCGVCSKEGIETPLVPLNKFLPILEGQKQINVVLREEMHIAINPATGKTKEGVLFGYISVESGQYFVGLIEIEDWVNFVNLIRINESNENITFELRLGKASSRGYGKVKVWLQSKENPENIFLGKPLGERVIDLTQPITMTFITDAILMDCWGRFLTLHKELLDKEYEKSLKELLELNIDIKEITNTYVKSKIVDGFNTYLGLPKWRDFGITAGSSICFKLKSPDNKDEILKRLGEIEKEGIGLRREEGFGRVAFNHPVYSKNEGVMEGIHLPEFMRIKKIEKMSIEIFKEWWKKYLDKINRKNFMDRKWVSVSRFLRANTDKTIEEIREMVDKFHILENPLQDLIKKKNVYRDEKEFLEEDGKKGLDALLNSLKELSKGLQREDESLREYLKNIAMEMLADFIAVSAKEVEK